MKTKIILTSVLTIAIMSPVFGARITENTPATPGVGGSTTCDTATLGQSENGSTANVEADWSANTINIAWYSDNRRLIVPVSAGYCIYDSTITLPPQPTKTGYTFAGWKLREGGDIIMPVGNKCENLSQSECNEFAANDECFWMNNTCLEPNQFCRLATNEQECAQQHASVHSILSNVDCSWSNGGILETPGCYALFR